MEELVMIEVLEILEAQGVVLIQRLGYIGSELGFAGFDNNFVPVVVIIDFDLERLTVCTPDHAPHFTALAQEMINKLH